MFRALVQKLDVCFPGNRIVPKLSYIRNLQASARKVLNLDKSLGQCHAMTRYILHKFQMQGAQKSR